jgi:hypothetical protein
MMDTFSPGRHRLVACSDGRFGMDIFFGGPNSVGVVETCFDHGKQTPLHVYALSCFH